MDIDLSLLMKKEAVRKQLASQGLACVCELCPCGRPHRHTGCKRFTSQSPWMQKSKLEPRSPRKDGHEMSPQSEPNASAPKCLPPDQPTKSSDSYSGAVTTTHRSDFRPMPASRVCPFSESPSTANALLYPERSLKVERLSYKNQDYCPKQGEVCSSIRPVAVQLVLPSMAESSLDTTYRHEFTQHVLEGRPSLRKPNGYHHRRPDDLHEGDFITQSKMDFKNFYPLSVRTRPIPPASPIVDLAFDNERYLDTTNSQMFVTHTAPATKQAVRSLAASSGIVLGHDINDFVTQSSEAFKRPPHESYRRRHTRPGMAPSRPTADRPIDMSTSYRTQFRSHPALRSELALTRAQRDKLSFRPRSGCMDLITNSMTEFVAHPGIHPPALSKPLSEPIRLTSIDESADWVSTYKEKFCGKKLEPCRLLEILQQLAAC